MKVELRENLRYFEAEDSDFSIVAKEVKELPEKTFKSYSIKYHLFNGGFQIIEGEALIIIKHAKILFSAETYPFCYGIEFGKIFKKNVDTQELVWIDKDEIPAIYEKLTGETVELIVEEPEVEEPEVEEPEVEEKEIEKEVMSDGNEPEAGFAEDEEEKVSKEDIKYTKADEIKILEGLGLTSKEIKNLGNSENRRLKIYELEN